MKEVFEEAAKNAQTTVDFSHKVMYPAFKFEGEHPLVKTAIKAVEAIGRKPELKASGGGSDANVINGYGVPTINLGLGYEKIHTTQEKIPITELSKATELVLELMKQ